MELIQSALAENKRVSPLLYQARISSSSDSLASELDDQEVREMVLNHEAGFSPSTQKWIIKARVLC